MTGFATHWAFLINDSICNPIADASPEEAHSAMTIYAEAKGLEYVKSWNLGSLKWLDTEDREALAAIIADVREASAA